SPKSSLDSEFTDSEYAGMKSLTVCLPDLVFDRAASEADKKGVELSGLCSSILADHLLAHFSLSRVSSALKSSTPLGHSKHAASSPAAVPQAPFNVADHSKGFPAGSTRFAQAFVDEALKLPGVQAFKTSRGIGFKPNFVF